jgi:hypothetical protein
MAKKKKQKKPAPPPTVDSILAECEKQVRSGLGKKRMSRQAREFWEDEYRKSITAQLAKAGSNWLVDRKRVLPVAKKLGKVAAALATGQIVLLWAADAAATAVQSDPGCPGAGAGGYCNI